jgi:hypothetical protein
MSCLYCSSEFITLAILDEEYKLSAFHLCNFFVIDYHTLFFEKLKCEKSAVCAFMLVYNSLPQIPAILAHHEVFLEELRKRLQHWDIRQKVGDVFLDVVSKVCVGVCLLMIVCHLSQVTCGKYIYFRLQCIFLFM